MTDETLSDDPTYRAGILMGRNQSVTDVMGLLLDPDGGVASARLQAVLTWCAQTQEETAAELQMVVEALREGEG